MTDVDSQSFDLIQALDGISYPEETFPIFFDSKSAQKLYSVNRRLDATDPTSEEFKELEKEFLDLVNEFKGSRYEVTIRGLSSEHYQDAIEVLLKEVQAFSKNSDPGAAQRVEVENFIETRTEQLLWAQHIVKITDPQGRVRAPITNEEATALYNRLPEESQKEVSRQIEEMKSRTSSGYEIGITDFDFLSEPSQEG